MKMANVNTKQSNSMRCAQVCRMQYSYSVHNAKAHLWSIKSQKHIVIAAAVVVPFIFDIQENAMVKREYAVC